MANKARYYGLSTREERQDMADNSRAARIYPAELGYRAVKAAILNYKDTHPNFNELSSTVAANRIAIELNATGRYGKVTASGSRIEGSGYSVALTKNKDTITISKASERINEDLRKRRKK